MKKIAVNELVDVVGGNGPMLQLPVPMKLPGPAPLTQLPPAKLPPPPGTMMPRGGWPKYSAGWWELARASGNIR